MVQSGILIKLILYYFTKNIVVYIIRVALILVSAKVTIDFSNICQVQKIIFTFNVRIFNFYQKVVIHLILDT